MKTTLKETRLADVKFEESEGKMTLEGYAIVFDQETLIGNEDHGFTEVISRQALQDTQMKDVPMKYNHMDSFLIIARTKNQSLRLSVDEMGLKVHADLLDTHSHQDIYKMVRSGLLKR
jgi:HK97 family phage prohead protease